MVIIGTLSLLNYSINQSILKPYSSVDYLKDSGIIEGMERIIPELIKGNNVEENMGQDDQIMKEALQEVIQKHITDDWIYNKLTLIQREIWDYILEKDSKIEGIDISDVTTPFMAAIKEKLLAKYPKEMVEENLKAFEQNFKGKLNWAEVYGVETERLDEIKMYYERYKQLSLSLIISFIITTVLSFLVIYNFHKMLKWFGTICVVISGILLITFMAWTFFDKQIFYSKIQLPTIYKNLESNVIQLAELVTSDFFKHLGWSALTVFFLGAILLIISFFTKKHKKELNIS